MKLISLYFLSILQFKHFIFSFLTLHFGRNLQTHFSEETKGNMSCCFLYCPQISSTLNLPIVQRTNGTLLPIPEIIQFMVPSHVGNMVALLCL